jgi:hypothetical protein
MNYRFFLVFCCAQLLNAAEDQADQLKRLSIGSSTSSSSRVTTPESDGQSQPSPFLPGTLSSVFSDSGSESEQPPQRQGAQSPKFFGFATLDSEIAQQMTSLAPTPPPVSDDPEDESDEQDNEPNEAERKSILNKAFDSSSRSPDYFYTIFRPLDPSVKNDLLARQEELDRRIQELGERQARALDQIARQQLLIDFILQKERDRSSLNRIQTDLKVVCTLFSFLALVIALNSDTSNTHYTHCSGYH